MLHIIGKSEDKRYRKLVEPFLFYPPDSMISRIALKTLCSYFDLTKHYLKELAIFINGVEWDDANQVHSVAVSIAGTYTRESGDLTLLRPLIDLFEKNPQDEWVYAAISDATGHGYSIDVTNLKIIEEAYETLNIQGSL